MPQDEIFDLFHHPQRDPFAPKPHQTLLHPALSPTGSPLPPLHPPLPPQLAPPPFPPPLAPFHHPLPCLNPPPPQTLPSNRIAILQLGSHQTRFQAHPFCLCFPAQSPGAPRAPPGRRGRPDFDGQGGWIA